jgi:hypothetical protein
MAILEQSQSENMALRPQHGYREVKFPLTLVAAPLFLTVRRQSSNFIAAGREENLPIRLGSSALGH